MSFRKGEGWEGLIYIDTYIYNCVTPAEVAALRWDLADGL